MRIREAGLTWEIGLEDDGTMDTLISVRPIAIRHRYSGQPHEYWPAVTVRFDGE